MQHESESPLKQDLQRTQQSIKPSDYILDKSEIDFLAECIAKTIVSDTPIQQIPIGDANAAMLHEKQGEAENILNGVLESNCVKQEQVSPEQQEMVDEIKQLTFRSLSFSRKRERQILDQSENGALENQKMFELDWVELEKLPLYQVHNTANEFKVYPILSQRLKLETVIAAHYHQSSGIPLSAYSTGVNLPTHEFTSSQLQHTVCAVLLTAYRHLESYVRIKLRSDIVRIEGEDIAEVLRMLVRVDKWKTKKCAETWLKFVLYAYDINEQAGDEEDIKNLYMYIQADSSNKQYKNRAVLVKQASVNEIWTIQLSLCQLFLQKRSFPGAAQQFNTRYDKNISQLELRHIFENVLLKTFKILINVLETWQLCEFLPPIFNNITKRTLLRHPSGQQLRIKLVAMYIAENTSTNEITSIVDALRVFLQNIDKQQPTKMVSNKHKGKQPIQEESERETKSRQVNQTATKNRVGRPRLTGMLDEQYDIENQVDLNRDHKGRFMGKTSTNQTNGVLFPKQKVLHFGQDPSNRNRLKLMSRYE